MIRLRIGAYMNFVIAAGHVAALFFLDAAFRYYGIDGMMDRISQCGAAWPYVITLCLVVGFALFGLYGLSGAGRIRRLPLLWTGVFGIAAVYLLRALWGLWSMICDGFSMRSMTAALMAGIVGLLYLSGGMAACRQRKSGH